MQITIQQYNTAIEGQKMQSELLRQQVVELIAQANSLRTSRDAHAVEYYSLAKWNDELSLVIQVACGMARGEVPALSMPSQPAGADLFDAIRTMQEQIQQLASDLEDALARKRKK